MSFKEVPLILIVDDSLISLRLAEKALKMNGYETLTCQSGRDGLRLAKEIQPDLILLDVMMPEMNGYETCRLIKEDEIISSIPIIFITALNRKVDIEDCINAGGSGYLSKPYTPDRLFECVETHLNISKMTRKNRVLDPVEIKKRFDVLIVDDSEVMRKIIKKRIQEMDIEIGEIQTAENGMDALEFLETQHFDLCFCDWNMPKMNGLTFVRKVKEKPGHQDMPIIMVTTEGSERKIDEAQQAGASGYVTKPFSPEQLHGQICEVIATKIF